MTTDSAWTDGQPCGKHELAWCADCRPAGRRGLWQSLPPAPLRSYSLPSNMEAAQRYAAARYAPPPGWSYVGWTDGGVHLTADPGTSVFPDPRWVQWWESLMAMAEPALEAEMGPWVTADWPGRCRACGERWEPGELIRRSEDEGGYVCESCGADG